MSHYCNTHGPCHDRCGECFDKLIEVLDSLVRKVEGYYPEGLHPDGDELKEAKALLKELK